MKLTPTYNEKGEQRSYYIGEDGNEYFMYKDRTGYTIREMNKEDIQNWYKVMKEESRRVVVNPIQKAIEMAKVSQKVEQMIGDSREKSFLILNTNDQIVGEVDFTENDEAIAVAELFLKDVKTCKNKGMRCFEMISRMNYSEGIYDEIWTVDINKKPIRIS